jgi:cell division protein FtsB
MRFFLPYVLYTVWCLSKSYAHTNNCKKQLAEKREKIRKMGKTEEKHNSTD